MELLHIKKTIDESSNLTHKDYNFFVDKSYAKLIIKFSYYPKKLEDREDNQRLIKDCVKKYIPYREFSEEELEKFAPLGNLLSIAVDNPKESLGAAHHHKNIQEHYISKDISSRGFQRSEIIKGQWNITVSVHSIATKNINYELIVEAL